MEQAAEELSQAQLKQTSKQAEASQLAEQQPVSISYSHNNMHVQQNSDGELEVQPQSLTAQVESEATQKIKGRTRGRSVVYS